MNRGVTLSLTSKVDGGGTTYKWGTSHIKLDFWVKMGLGPWFHVGSSTWIWA